MTLTRIGPLVVALAFATGPACKDRSPERQAAARPAPARPPAADLHAAGAPLRAGAEPVALETGLDTPAAPLPGDAAAAIADQVDEALAAGDAATQLPDARPRVRQHALTEAQVQRAVSQVEARMNDELARARKVIVELQRANAELRQALAAERLQLAELHKRLISGRSVALQ